MTSPLAIIAILIKPIAEILILWFVFYQVLVFFEGTRAFQVLKGLIYLLAGFLIFQLLGLETINWLLRNLLGMSILGFLILFQQEIRHGLARLGQQHLFSASLEESEVVAMLDEMSASVYKLAQRKIGCLIALERETKLKTYIDSGVAIDGKVSSELIQSIFVTTSPLHDGGIIIRNDRILAAACLFPLSENINLSKIIGTRHRAALGLSEQTDAIVVMVSEETGNISIATEGRFIPVVNKERFLATLKNFLIRQK
ncbi:MAG TPA: diadenylate cyclase CdaA [Candidatus Omnitrophota bacterium]|nr:diadenylate cyclase CdaA [Candidatus Omnitrophota bacterium]HQL40792.1 diadenylate cyclase CdaA [Candidatus Omnitrophota bacterium]